MFFNYNFMQDSNSINFTPTDIVPNGIQLRNGIFDEMDLANILSVSAGVFDTSIPQSWSANTIANCNFEGTINAGSIGEFISSISRLEVQKREVGTTEWITLMVINKVGESINASFTMYDSYCANGVQYEYAIVPYDISGNEGQRISQTVFSTFDKAYICDANQIFDITASWTVNEVQTVQKSAVYEPYGSQFPFVAFNALTQYRSGSSTAVLLAPTSNQSTTSYLDRKAQMKLVDEFNTWLTNRQGKILKDFNGNIRLIAVHNSIGNDYYKELGNGLASTNFSWVEIGEINQKYLSKNGMLGKFPIIFVN